MRCARPCCPTTSWSTSAPAPACSRRVRRSPAHARCLRRRVERHRRGGCARLRGERRRRSRHAPPGSLDARDAARARAPCSSPRPSATIRSTSRCSRSSPTRSAGCSIPNARIIPSAIEIYGIAVDIPRTVLERHVFTKRKVDSYRAEYGIDFAPLEQHRLSCSEPIMLDSRDVATWPLGDASAARGDRHDGPVRDGGLVARDDARSRATASTSA